MNLGFNESTVGITKKLNNIKIFPNPSTDAINITFEDNSEKNITIRDMNGKLVIETKLINSKMLNISNFKKGSYIAEVEINGKIVSKQFIIE